MTDDRDALTLIQRIAAGDFSGFNGSVKAAQDWLTARTAFVQSRRPFDDDEDDSQRLSGFRGYMS